MIEEAPTGAVTLDEALAHGIAFTRAARVNLTAHADTASTAWLRGCDLGTGTRLGLGLAALAWRELRDPDRRRTCEALIDIPSTAPVVALKLTHERRQAMEALGPTHPPVERDEAMVFALEIEGADPEWPQAVAHWVHAGSAQHEVAAVWTTGAHASAERPLVVGMRWDEPGGGEAAAGAMRWPAPGETGGREERSVLDIAARSHHEWMRTTLVPTIVHRAMQAWAGARARAEADGPAPARGGFRRSAGGALLGRGARGAKRRKQQWREARARMRNAPPLESAPCPQTTHERADALPREPGTGLDAMLTAAARLQDQMGYGGKHAAQIWSDAWWHRAEGGMISWRALGAMDTTPDSAGIIMRSGDLHEMMGAPCQRALRERDRVQDPRPDRAHRARAQRRRRRGARNQGARPAVARDRGGRAAPGARRGARRGPMLVRRDRTPGARRAARARAVDGTRRGGGAQRDGARNLDRPRTGDAAGADHRGVARRRPHRPVRRDLGMARRGRKSAARAGDAELRAPLLAAA